MRKACSLEPLAIPGSPLAACCRNPEAWSLQLLAIDPDPGAILGPGVAHDLELSCDAQQLARISVGYFY